MADSAQSLLADALAGDRNAVRALVRALAPIVQARVARALVRRRAAARGRDVRQEVEDFSQEVFVALFEDSGRVLRAWRPARGLSLENFVGLVAERQAISLLRCGRRSPWTEDPTLDAELEADRPDERGPESVTASRELYERLLERVEGELSPLGLELFRRLLVQQQPVAEVCAELGQTPDAVYAWRSRLGKLVRKLAADLVSDPTASQRTPRWRTP